MATDKSINDIDRQVKRIIEMLNPNDKREWRYPQRIYQIARKVKSKRGFGFFDKDKDVKKPWSPDKFEHPSKTRTPIWWKKPVLSRKPKAPEVKKEPVVLTDEQMRAYEHKLNQLGRHEAITKLLADISTDMVICQLNGWNAFEYSQMIQAELSRILAKKPKVAVSKPLQLSLFEE